MTTALDIEVLAEVKEVLAEVGASATYTNNPTSVYDPIEGEMTVGTPVNTSLKCIPQYTQSTGNKVAKQMKTESVFAAEDLLTGIAGDALAVEPKVADTMTIGTKNYSITGIDPIRAGDDVALYILRIEETR